MTRGTTDEIRVGVLGYGLAGSAFHAPFIATTPGLRLSAIVTGNPERAAAAAERYPDAGVVGSAEDILDPTMVDLVVVATPNDSHVPLAARALESGLDVVVDKPLAPTAAQARRLGALAEDRGRLLTVYQNRRWDGDFRTARALIDDGTLGVVRRFESRFEGWSPKAKGGWRESGDPALAGGLLYDLGAHLVDQAVTLFGPVATVYAELDIRREGVTAEDDAFVALHHESGVRSHLWMSKVASHLGPRLRVLGSKAAFVTHGLDGQEAMLRAGRAPDGADWAVDAEGPHAELTRGTESEPVTLEPGDYGSFYAEVERALRTGSAPPVTATEAAYVLDVLAAARRSARIRSVEPVETPGR